MYLLNKKAKGVAAASNCHNQDDFMRLMGITDSQVETPAGNWPNPLSEAQAQLLATANSHSHSSKLECIDVTDGLYIPSELDTMIAARDEGRNVLCGCNAHAELTAEGDKNLKRHLRQLIRTEKPLNRDTGTNFALALLELLLMFMGHRNLVVQQSGYVDGVSYVLWCEEGEFNYPDFSVHREGDFMANRILVVMGEVQLTKEPSIQNAIYAVGNLPKTSGKALLVLTLYKSKTATLAIARMREASSQPSSQPSSPSSSPPPSAVGIVTLKYYSSPHPMDLCTIKGVTDLAEKLHHYFTTEGIETCSP